eukprot:CAMPEP_0194753804 /NCGR_PEP_ID=MMETSP0323_2-20130528/7777_1 /TAXON_ID=2866 ORGANISM="Crypthecodinium cohnii, Strain Seligo" /NCGR_SAMPLE_ID=MMETSP0323_2 /ASSEMBLY_ACC=CAM_ASM_000346 /LENGTH=116 /DNA_ID=CAMNT_0039671915 /DNA_START=387 /DNA_END=738 /DNA_ORIENTATION=-
MTPRLWRGTRARMKTDRRSVRHTRCATREKVWARERRLRAGAAFILARAPCACHAVTRARPWCAAPKAGLAAGELDAINPALSAGETRRNVRPTCVGLVAPMARMCVQQLLDKELD